MSLGRDHLCARAIIRMSLVWSLVTLGLLIAHPKMGLAELLSLPGIYLMFISIAQYLALAGLAWWLAPFSRGCCLILVAGAFGIGVLGMLGWYLMIDAWSSWLSVVISLAYVSHQWMILGLMLLLLLVVYWRRLYMKKKYQA